MDASRSDPPRGSRRRLALTLSKLRWADRQTGRAAGNASFAGLSGPLVSGIRLLWVGVGGGGQSYTGRRGDAAPLCRRLWIQHPGNIRCV
ncbi:Hypothetical predicted protein [Xyrichtys novacula]|uniref:Uncharacterized protein n=1 Tax=Xyrichtys novacula TaxID=13765 RepID=A0AAV1HQJ8_XYRNO|nr:Hypothetical predicted protein [Xyrichtys novacula]